MNDKPVWLTVKTHFSSCLDNNINEYLKLSIQDYEPRVTALQSPTDCN